MTRMILVGNPNCGKTTLFNALTGENQRVGNWPGVTVEKKEGSFSFQGSDVQVMDLPGLYSLAIAQHDSSIDQCITAKAVIEEDFDLIVNVIDACQLERHLYLTSQLLELRKPLLVVLNMSDIAERRGISIDANVLSERLGCPVVQTEAHHGRGIDALRDRLAFPKASPPSLPLSLQLPKTLIQSRESLIAYGLEKNECTSDGALYWANRQIESGLLPSMPIDLAEDSDIVMADARYSLIHQLVRTVQKKRRDTQDYVTAKIDRIVLHRYLALPIFLGVMYAMFFFTIHVGGIFQEFFDAGSDTLFVKGSAALLRWLNAPNWLMVIVSNGVARGINTTLTFVPVIASLFFFLALLETSGYMARAAFIIDRVMRALGLPGKAFVPMIVGFGCNVPAVLASRTLDSERDRLLTVLISPFMSCSARLAIYAIFVTTFFPNSGHNVVFSLYMIGILMAVLTGFLLRKMMFSQQSAPLLLELPAYHKPTLRRLYKETVFRLRYFIIRAGKLIIPACVILGGMNAFTLGDGFGTYSGESLLSVLGRSMMPLFSPMGLSEENWPAGIGLLSGVLAKEVVIGTLQTLYAQMGHLVQASVTEPSLWLQLKAAFLTIPDKFAHIGSALLHPLASSIPEESLSSSVRETMFVQFDGWKGAYAYLLFVLLYIPCVSTMAVIRNEAGRRLMWFSILWSSLLAYGISVGFYQIVTVMEHPLKTLLWELALAVVWMQTIRILHKILCQPRSSYVIAAS